MVMQLPNDSRQLHHFFIIERLVIFPLKTRADPKGQPVFLMDLLFLKKFVYFFFKCTL